MKVQKIIATIVAIAISSAGFAKEIATRPNPVQASKSFNSKVFDVDNNRKIQAVELSKQEMQETEGEFLPLVAIGLGAIAFGMWIKHGESYAKTGEPASVKEVAKAGAIEGATSAIPGGSAIGTVKKVETVAKVTKAVSNTKKTTNAVNTVNNTKKIANTTTNYAPKTTKLNTLTKSNAVDLSKKAPNSVYNQQAVKKLNNGELVGVTKNGKLGSPREMPATRNPNATANDFVQKYGQLNGGFKNIRQETTSNGISFPVYELNKGGFISYRQAGAAGKRTFSTTATVEINTTQIKSINNSERLKLKFPVNK